MSTILSAFMFMALLALAFAHLIWSLGRTWPIRTEKLLAETVIGTAGIEHMPPRLRSFGMAVFLFCAALLASALAEHDSGGLPLTLLGLPFAALFLWRGWLGYTADWQQKTPQPSFRLNDRRVYSPLSLFLGAGFVALVVLRLL
jgi:hypothetical protein